jgi:hypothetical protein
VTTNAAQSTWAPFIEAELKAERERRATLDTRAVAVVTTSGTLVTLVFAIGGLTLGSRNIPVEGGGLSGWSVWPAVAALIMFTFAATLALYGGRNVPYEVADKTALAKMTTTHWAMNEDDARQVVLYYNVGTIDTLREGNNHKARMLILALAAQLVAIAAIVWGISAVMIGLLLR